MQSLKYAAQHSNESESSVDQIREALFSDREQAVQRLIEELGQAKSQLAVTQDQLKQVQNKYEQQNANHQRLKAIYAREHSELRQLRL